MAACEAAGLQWTEEPVTEILLSRTSPRVRFATFTRKQEAKVGADWLWWWVAPSGESFGMIVQAKRLYVDKAKWSFKFNHNSGEQRRAYSCDHHLTTLCRSSPATHWANRQPTTLQA
ncbi:hypothetical protein CEY15_06300 [Dietzia natronolimnaea]|uniref:Uncharacterized protein n=2 Tax=Dietzia natronolimnaea TaxID=161920 RepID=A0A2A2WRM7_9ACTN|nr:hypothetical protein CEY15_06300 [Dietzia natronolimnaea]